MTAEQAAPGEWFMSMGIQAVAKPGEPRKFCGIHVIEKSAYDAMKAERDELKKALEQYADDNNWCHDTSEIGRELAKEILAKWGAK